MSQPDEGINEKREITVNIQDTGSHSIREEIDERMEWTEKEERRVLKALDKQLMPIILLMAFVLNMDKTNLSNAISDNLAADLGFNNDGVNLGILLFQIVYTVAIFVSGAIGKAVGTYRWLPILLTSWAIITWAHALVQNFAGFLLVRVLVAVTEGGFVPTILMYMTQWYKTTEMATRLSFLWAAQSFAAATSGLIAFGVFRLEGVLGLQGWKWLFIIDGVATHVVALIAFFYLPSSPLRTVGKLRGKKGWFANNRQSTIAMLRIIREDETKKSNNEHIKLIDIMQAVKDTNLWVHVIIIFLWELYAQPIRNYLPSIVKDAGFATSTANMLAAPAYIINLVFSVIIGHQSDKREKVALYELIGILWALTGICLLEFLPDTVGRWSLYGAALFAASAPSWYGMHIAWTSANMAPDGKRSVAMAAVTAFANIGGVPGSQIYQASDAPRFKKGNLMIIGFLVATLTLVLLQRARYVFVNKWRQAKWNKMNDIERQEYLDENQYKGNNRLDFVYRL